MRHLILSLHLIFVCCLLATQFAFAQDTTARKVKRSYISFVIERSIPVGAFSRTEANGGYALSGIGGYFEAMGNGTENINWGLKFGAFSNPLDPNLIKTKVFSSTNSYQVEGTDNWLSYYFMTGPYITIPIKQMRWSFKAMGGYLISHPAQVTFKDPFAGSSNSYTFSAEETRSFGYNLGTFLWFNTDKLVHFRLGVDYVHSKPEITYRLIQNRNSSTTSTQFQSISTLSLSWGILF